MSILWGIINKKHKAIDQRYISAMVNSCLLHPLLSHPQWNAKDACGGVLFFKNSYHNNIAADAVQSNLLQNSFFSAKGRIDNQKEIIHEISVNTNPLNDFQLIAQCFEKWGNDCCNMLSGDWCFSHWDADKSRLNLCRDACGNTNLFYYDDSEYFVYCSSIVGILSLPFVNKEINELKIASTLAAWQHDTSLTNYKYIRQVQPGHFLTLIKNEVQLHQYWHPQNIKEDNRMNEEDAYELFRDSFFRAVSDRLKKAKKTCVFLSGGLDSSSLAATAAILMQKENRCIDSFSFIPATNDIPYRLNNKIPNERLLIEKYPPLYPNIRQHFFDASEAGVLAGIEQAVAMYHSSIPATSNVYWIHLLTKKAVEQGYDTLITGQGGNHTLSWPSSGLILDLIRRDPDFKLQNFLSMTLFRKKIIKPLTPILCLKAYAGIISGNQPWMRHSMMSESLNKRVKLKQQIFDSGFFPPLLYPSDPKLLQYEGINPLTKHPGYFHAMLSDMYDIHDVDPTYDKRFIELCLSFPIERFVNRDKSRRLVRDGLKNILPEAIIHNHQRGIQSADIGVRLFHEKKQLAIIQDRMHSSDFISDYLDLKKIDIAIHDVITMKSKSIGNIIALTRAIGVFLFIEKNR